MLNLLGFGQGGLVLFFHLLVFLLLLGNYLPLFLLPGLLRLVSSFLEAGFFALGCLLRLLLFTGSGFSNPVLDLQDAAGCEALDLGDIVNLRQQNK
jgi:hypothetical protein